MYRALSATACLAMLVLGSMSRATAQIPENIPVPTKYPPKSYHRLQTMYLSGDIQIERWIINGAEKSANENRGPDVHYVIASGKATRLPEATVDGEETNLIGNPSEFSIAPGGKFICRTQRWGFNSRGAYLYRRVEGGRYEVAVPDLSARASEFFQQRTKLTWSGGAGVINASEWLVGDRLVLSVSGQTHSGDNAAVCVNGWRCIYDPATGAFTEWSNDAAIQRNASDDRAECGSN